MTKQLEKWKRKKGFKVKQVVLKIHIFLKLILAAKFMFKIIINSFTTEVINVKKPAH